MNLVKNMDNIYATRVLSMILTPFDKTAAFKHGLIDAKGNKLKNPKTQEELEIFSSLHQVVFKLRQLIERLPGGDFRLVQIAVVLQLIRQRQVPKQYLEGIAEDYCVEFLSRLKFVKEHSLVLVEEEDIITRFVNEEGEVIANTTANVAPVGEPVIDPKKKPKKPISRLDESMKDLYVHRNLKNTDKFIDWAKSQGFAKTVNADDLHATICFSRNPVKDVEPKTGEITVTGGNREVIPLGDKGAVVLKFESPELTKRWQEFRDAGASWDYEGYNPHVTITYSDPEVDLSKVTPFEGDLVFLDEIFEPLDLDWSDKVVEE